MTFLSERFQASGMVLRIVVPVSRARLESGPIKSIDAGIPISMAIKILPYPEPRLPHNKAAFVLYVFYVLDQ